MKSTLLFLMLLSVTANSFSQKIYVDKHFGCSIAEPKLWIIKNNRLFLDSLFKANVDADTTELIDENNGALLLAKFQKYGDNKVGFIPIIEISVLNNQSLSLEDFIEDIKASSNQLKSQYKDFSFINEAHSTVINGHKAISFSGKFSLTGTKKISIEAAGQKINGNKSYQLFLQTTIYAIPFGKYFFQFSFVSELGNKEDEAVFAALVQSTKILK